MRYLFFLLFTTFCFAQQTDVVDFLKISATVTPNAEKKLVKGDVSVSFNVLKKTDAVYLDAIAMTADKEHSDSLFSIAFTEDEIWIGGDFEPGYTYQASFSYTAAPKKALYFTEDQIWTQGQGKNTSHWLPSIDDMNDKIEFDLEFVTNNKATVISNGLLARMPDKDSLVDRLLKIEPEIPVSEINKIVDENYQPRWRFDMQKPMSSYLVAFAMGDFDKKELVSSSGVPIELYYRPQDSLKVEATYRYTKDIFDFLESKIGVPYPWQNYKQVPVRDFLYAGMENTGCTLFSEAFVVDEIGFNDKNYVNVNAHELAHQWFGNLITETEGTHHWLHEGFATYYALQAERAIFGEEYYYWKLYQSAEKLIAISNQGKGQSLLNPKASSLTFYEKGAWALHILNETVGDEVFDRAVKNYLNKHAFGNVTTEDFVNEIKTVSSVDISAWEKDWLQQTAFQANAVYESMLKSPFMTSLFDIMRLRNLPISEKKNELNRVLTFPTDFIGQEAILQLDDQPWDEVEFLYKKGMASNNLFVRQAIALQMDKIPDSFKVEFESLLDDDSYATKEAALMHLVTNFPSETSKYLDKIKDIEGFQDKNIRQQFLAYSLATRNYGAASKKELQDELVGYLSGLYSFEIREIAFGYINQLGMWDNNAVHYLINACTHHYWRFRNGARDLLDEKLKESSFRKTIQTIYGDLNEAEKEYLVRIGFNISVEKK
ncbi:aminopeptidase [unidentified eubacterium SCB49]|nr:aminopeptidase [unidentified eubacterium SCB49]